ncbi:endoplasmic oxidoreductin-1 [Ceratobasidium sp. AG-Ba]|nr:endoplasmic oxidoreductin-1 [Ceratobasidium sp. AG-Ba]
MASVKLATLVIRTLAKPIANNLKHQAEQHETFRNICISWAQWAHRTEVSLRTNIMGEPAKHVKPLSETRAIQNGANSLAEAFLFSVAAGLILAEAWRSNRSQARRRDDVDDQLDDLRADITELRSEIKAMAQGWEQALDDERSRNNELSRILTRVVEIGLRGGWAEIVDQAPLKIPSSVVSHTELADPRASPIETTQCDFETVEGMNNRLFAQLSDLVTTPFFKYFRADLYRECPFWQDDGKCAMRECGVTSVDESEVPETWRAATLSKVQGLSEESRRSFPGCYYRDSDFCFLDDDTSSDGEYIDLTANPERYTGYSGPDARKVWQAIYEENCFGLTETKQVGKLSGLGVPSSRPIEGIAVPPGLTGDISESGTTWEAAGASCLEKRVYYRIISGLHASISTHICAEMLDRQTGQWVPDLQCYIDRVASHPERLQNIYFNAVLMLRALRKVGPYLAAYDICSGNHEEEQRTRFLLYNVLDIAGEAGKFDESTLFKGADAAILREEFKDRFRNVTRIMDCIGCSKCRLWGKIQTTGVATALKILFEFDKESLDPRINPNLLQRTEVVALINTLHRLSESLHAVQKFQGMWEQEYGAPAKSASPPQETTSTAPKSTPNETTSKPDLMARVAGMCPECVKTWATGVREFASGLMTEMEDLFSMSKDGIPRPDL